MKINEIQDAIIEEFSTMADWLEKYDYLINFGSSFEPMKEESKTEDKLVSGCQSRVWLEVENRDNLMHLTADGEAPITKGIVALLLRVLNDQSPKEVLDSDLYFIDKIGLRTNLSPARANGLEMIVEKIKFYAKSAVDNQRPS